MKQSVMDIRFLNLFSKAFILDVKNSCLFRNPLDMVFTFRNSKHHIRNLIKFTQWMWDNLNEKIILVFYYTKKLKYSFSNEHHRKSNQRKN